LATKTREAWALLTPALLFYTAFSLPTYVIALLGSVWEMGAYGEGWIGFRAFRDVFTSQRFWQSLVVTLRFVVVNVPISMVGAIAVAVVIGMARPRARGWLRMAYYVPTATSGIAISVVWRWILSPSGPINKLLGVDIPWLGTAPYAFYAINLMLFVTTTGGLVLWLSAALSSVDPELYEAARLDGCNRAQEARYITIPAVAPIVAYMTLTKVAGVMQLWQFPYALTGGGPSRTTMTTMLLIYQEATAFGRPAHAAVMTLVLIVIVAAPLVLYSKITGRSLV
jgi:ABC-type sugar transport system permease subunit